MNNIKSLLPIAGERSHLELIHPTRSVFIHTSEVVFIQADVNYVRIFTKSGKQYVQAKTLKSYEALLKKTPFIRTHKSYLVNFEYFADYTITEEGTFVHLVNGKKLPVSKRRRQFVKKSLEYRQIA